MEHISVVKIHHIRESTSLSGGADFGQHESGGFENLGGVEIAEVRVMNFFGAFSDTRRFKITGPIHKILPDQ